MINSLFLRNTIFSKKSIVLIFTIFFEIYIIFKFKNNSTTCDFSSLYENILLLFKFPVIIIEYLLSLSMYLENYGRDYIILRYVNIKSAKRSAIKDVTILTISFVFIFNIISTLLIHAMFNPVFILEELKYMSLTTIFQLLSFLVIGYLSIIFFFKNNNLRKVVLIMLILYFILILAFENSFSYFVLPADMQIYEVINMFKVMINVFIILILFLLYNKDKVVEVYGCNK